MSSCVILPGKQGLACFEQTRKYRVVLGHASEAVCSLEENICQVVECLLFPPPRPLKSSLGSSGFLINEANGIQYASHLRPVIAAFSLSPFYFFNCLVLSSARCRNAFNADSIVSCSPFD